MNINEKVRVLFNNEFVVISTVNVKSSPRVWKTPMSDAVSDGCIEFMNTFLKELSTLYDHNLQFCVHVSEMVTLATRFQTLSW